MKGIVALWREVFAYDTPHSDPALSIERKVAHDPDLFLVAAVEGAVIGTVMGGYDGHRGWIYSLAVAEGERHRGTGTALILEVERKLKALGCLKVNLQVLPSNRGVIDFYEKLGFSVEERVNMGKTLYKEP